MNIFSLDKLTVSKYGALQHNYSNRATWKKELNNQNIT